MRRWGGILSLALALTFLLALSGSASANTLSNDATFTGTTYLNEHFRMEIGEWGSILYDRHGSGVLALLVDWIVAEENVSGAVEVRDWTAAPILNIRERDGVHYVETSGQVAGGLDVKIRYEGAPVAPIDSGPKISVELHSVSAHADFHVGWRFVGVSAALLQLEHRNDSVRELVKAWRPGDPASFHETQEANSLVSLDPQGKIRFGANWDDALFYYEGTQFLYDPVGPGFVAWFGPVHLEPGETTLLDPLLEGGGGGNCYPGIQGYVTETGTGKALYKVKVRAQRISDGLTYTVYTNTNGFYSMATQSGSYTAWVMNSKGVLGTPSQSAATSCSKASLSFQTQKKLFWSINFHDGDAGYDLPQTKQAFDYMRDLGVWHVRSDLAWSHLQPNSHLEWDQGKLDWWRDYIDAAKERGLDVIVLLTNPPGWATSNYGSGNKEGFFRAWWAYAERIAQEFGDDVYYYQMSNEENHPIRWSVSQGDEARLFEEAFLGISAGEGFPFSEDFDDGVANGWTFTGGSMGLWRVASDCITPWRGNYMLAFSRPSPNCDFDIGWAYGSAYSPYIDLSGVSEAKITFRHTWQTESSSGVYDIMRLFVSSDGVVYNMVKQWDSRDPNPGAYPNDWITETVDVSDYISSQFRFFFNFDSKDGTFNDYLGWYIDSVQVTSPDHTAEFKTIVNALANTGGWYDSLDTWLSDSGDYIDIAAVDHYPVTWTCTNADDWSPLDSLLQLLVNHSKEGALMETGYSTPITWNFYNCHFLTESGQEQFVNTALPIINQKVSDHNVAHPTLKVLLGTWYELFDACTLCPIGLPTDKIEWNFGIRRNDWTAKPAHDDLELRIGEFNF